MPGKRRSHAIPDWQEIASLGEHLADADSLIAQRDRIAVMTGRIVRGKVDVWLDEDLFRLPDRMETRFFPARPARGAMRQAAEERTPQIQAAEAGSRKRVAAVPIEDRGLLLGVIQVTRSRGPDFLKQEIELLQSVAGVIALGLYGSHTAEVERFRLGELNLVRRVSAEIATVLPLDELSRRVCALIQDTFKYYYVAIFTLDPGSSSLRFRSSAGARHAGSPRLPLGFHVELGQGLIGEAAASGQIVQAADVRKAPRFRYFEPLGATRSEVVIPVKLEERVLGVLDVQSDRLDAFHRNDLMILEALADNVARAVEGARLYGDVRRRAEQLSLLAELSKKVTSTLELREIMAETAALIRGRMGFEHVALFTVHPIRRLIEYEAGSGIRARGLRGYSMSLDDPRGIIPLAAREAKVVLANDVIRDPRYRPAPVAPKNARSELTVPLVFGERTLGILDIQSEKANAFTDDDRLMFEAVAGTIAASIRNADLYRSEQWRRQAADSLREVAGRLSEHIGIDKALDAILTELARNLPVDASAIWLLRNDEPYAAAVHGAEVAAVQRAMTASPEMLAAFHSTLRSSVPQIRQATDPAEPLGKTAGFPRDYSALGAPMRAGDQAVGVIALAHRGRGRYGHEAQGMAATFASYAAVAIENARLYDAAQEQANASAGLLQVSQLVASPIGIEETLQGIMRIMPALLGVRSSAVYGWDSGRSCFVPRAEFGLPERAKAHVWNRDLCAGQFNLLEAAMKSRRRVVHVLRPDEAPESWAGLAPSRRIDRVEAEAERLLIAVPLLIKSDLVGALLVEEGDQPSRDRPRRSLMIQEIGQQIAMAMQADQLQREMVRREHLETEVELARQIQKTFIPQQLPQPEGWELAARWKTARQVGGDFYDVVELPGRRLGLFVADVSDKGMPAALFMALTRTLFRAAVAEGSSPAEALRRMNELLIPDTRQGMFVTAVYGVLDLDSGDFTYANAGHNPPFWIHRDCDAQELERTAIALGVIEGSEVKQRTVQLVRGESLLLFTDGVTEAFAPDGALFGETGLMEIIHSTQPGSAEALVRAVEEHLYAFMQGLPLADDLTMLAVRRQ